MNRLTDPQHAGWALKAEQMRAGVIAYLHAAYGPGDITWHPLWVAARELWHFLMWRDG